MHKFFYPSLIAAAIGLAFMWLKAHDREVAAMALAEARADSITYVLLQADSAYEVQDSLRAELWDSVATLEDENTIYRARMATLDHRSDSLLYALDIQLDADSIQDSTRAAIVAAVTVLQEQIWVCDNVFVNCEQRVTLLSRQLASDTILLSQARANVNEFATLYSQELRKRRGSKISVGLMGGVSAVYSGGRLYAGPSFGVGVTWNLFSIGGS